jgi:hypothetical protein
MFPQVEQGTFNFTVKCITMMPPDSCLKLGNLKPREKTNKLRGF